MNRSDFYLEAEKFLNKLFAQLEIAKVSIPSHWSVDHLCFRVSTQVDYERFKQDFSSFARLLIESEVNGRMIATYKLPEPVRFHGRSIDLVELPAPKPGKVTVEGFEHIEVITSESFAVLQKELAGQKLDEGGLKKLFNQELEVELEGCALKYHPLSLESVIEIEKNKKVHEALMQSKVLEVLRPYRPLVAGTFPLGLAVENSDLDIVLTAEDLSDLGIEIQKHFGSYEGFQLRHTEVAMMPTLIANFKFGDIPFELFAQAQESITQKAYRHFQVEERLLKLGGESFKKKILEQRQLGLKTEPAFAQVLGLGGDPYEEMLKLHAESEMELQRFF